jgi:membrane-bound inhibitor of C-type lysozyme
MKSATLLNLTTPTPTPPRKGEGLNRGEARRIMKVKLSGIFFGVLVFVGISSPASAQKFYNYTCADGSQFIAAFLPQSKSAYVQLDGKAMTLPQRLAASGARYAKSGVTFWIKGNEAQLKRPKKKWTQCGTVS